MIGITTTDGTFDKEYNSITGSPCVAETCVDRLLKQAKSTVKIVIESLFRVHSLDITEQHRKMIADACCNCPEERILITYGAGTMTVSTEFLAERITGKAVVHARAEIP